jgi:cereblon
MSSNPGTVVRTTRTITTTIRTRTEEVPVEGDHEDSLNEDTDEDEEETTTPSIAPSRAAEFSYWVAANLPLEDSQRVEFLSINCPIQRLRWLLSVLKKYLYLCCVNCKSKLCHRDDVFSMSVQGPQGTYINPSGWVHETVTVLKAESLRLNGRPQTEYSWFPGYAWTICECAECGHHVGWKFTVASNKKLQPEYFWGMTRSSIELGLKTDPEDIIWKPII